jgi:hypothetical protein
MHILDRVLQAKQQASKVTEEYAEKMGYDAGLNGPNTTNAHFTLFSRPEFTRAWERGSKRGTKARESAAQSPAKEG